MAFPARYPGRCPKCHQRIRVDDMITKDGAKYIHETCPNGNFKKKEKVGGFSDMMKLAESAIEMDHADETVTCPSCRGKRTVYGEIGIIWCPACTGTGQVESPSRR